MARKFRPLLLALGFLLAAAARAGAASPFVLEPFRVLLPGDLGTLEALFVRPSDPGRYPLALLAHGSPRAPAARTAMTPLAMLPQALEFARRGWAVVIVMRRGYGNSDGGWAEGFGACDSANYIAAGKAGAADLRTTLEFVAHRDDVDPARMIAVGVSAGGFATVALAADPPPGLVAAISFAGGRGSQESDHVCHPERLIDAFAAFGRTARVPMLWVYAENDHFFGPALAQELRSAFTRGGGSIDFVAAPAFGEDGHSLFSPAGIPQWTPYVDDFLRRQNLALRAAPLPLPQPAIAAPKILGASGQQAFATFLIDAPHKAFALSPDGHFGWQSGMRTVDAARAGALKFCQQSGAACSVGFVDDAAVGR
jgi:dienelactone hydrolase